MCCACAIDRISGRHIWNTARLRGCVRAQAATTGSLSSDTSSSRPRRPAAVGGPAVRCFCFPTLRFGPGPSRYSPSAPQPASPFPTHTYTHTTRRPLVPGPPLRCIYGVTPWTKPRADISMGLVLRAALPAQRTRTRHHPVHSASISPFVPSRSPSAPHMRRTHRHRPPAAASTRPLCGRIIVMIVRRDPVVVLYCNPTTTPRLVRAPGNSPSRPRAAGRAAQPNSPSHLLPPPNSFPPRTIGADLSACDGCVILPVGPRQWARNGKKRGRRATGGGCQKIGTGTHGNPDGRWLDGKRGM